MQNLLDVNGLVDGDTNALDFVEPFDGYKDGHYEPLIYGPQEEEEGKRMATSSSDEEIEEKQCPSVCGEKRSRSIMSISSSHESSDDKNNEEVARRSCVTSQKKSEWDDKLNCPSHIHIKDPNGLWIDCKYCNTRLGVRRSYNNEYWNRHVMSQSHLDQVIKQSGISTITNYFLPTKKSLC
jgi:hypothetical protein